MLLTRLANTRKRYFLAGVGILCATLVAACASGESDTVSDAPQTWNEREIIDQAKSQGEVVCYCVFPAEKADSFAAAFKKKYGVGLNAIYGRASDLLARAEEERRSGQSGVDLIITGDSAFYKAGVGNGSFADILSPRVDEESWATYVHDDQWVNVGYSPIGMAWNTDELDEEKVSYPGLLDPSLKGKIGLIDWTSPTIVMHYQTLEQEYGEDFLGSLAKQEPRFYAGSEPTLGALSSGEVAVIDWAYPGAVGKAQDNGAPVDVRFPAPHNTSAFRAAVTSWASNPHGAQLVLDFLLSEEGQEAFNFGGDLSPLQSVTPNANIEGLRVLDVSENPDEIEAFRHRLDVVFGR